MGVPVSRVDKGFLDRFEHSADFKLKNLKIR
jgi:hypothetical protein